MALIADILIIIWQVTGNVDALMKYFLKISNKAIKETKIEQKQEGHIIRALGKIGNAKAANALAEIAGLNRQWYRPNNNDKKFALEILAKTSPSVAVPALVQVVRQEKLEHHYFMLAIDALLRRMGDDGRRAIREELVGFSDYRCEAVIKNITGIGEPENFAVLVPLLQEASSEIKLAALDALILHPEVVDTKEILPLVEREDLYDYSITKKAYTLLGKKRWRPKGQETIIKKALIQEKSKPLVKIGQQDFKTLHGLMTLEKYNIPRAKNTVIKALGELGDPAVVPDLITLLNDNGPWNAVIHALDLLGDNRASKAMLLAYKKPRGRAEYFPHELVLEVLVKHNWQMDFVVSEYIQKLKSPEKKDRVKYAKVLVSIYQDDCLPDSAREQILDQREEISARHKDKSYKEHTDNGVRPKTRSHDCSHSDRYSARHDDEGIGVKSPLT